jgi:RNA-binding motif X-linked protein 2
MRCKLKLSKAPVKLFTPLTVLPYRPPEASWHADYRDTAYIYIGGLPFDLSEGDIVAIFSQYGEPVHVNLIRDKETGKSKGFAFLKYEDQRSTDLAVDNLGGATVMGRLLRVDHARYKRKDEEEEQDNVARLMGDPAITESKGKEIDRRKATEIEERRPILKEEKELEELIRNHDEEDPMKEFLIEEKKEEVAAAIQLWNSTKKSSRRRDDSRERSSRHHRRHRSRSPRERRHRDHRSPDTERRSRHRSSERGEKSRRDRSPRRSRSPESRRHRSDRDKHDRRH